MTTAHVQSSRDILTWQFKTLLGELQQIELHVSSGDCPCILKDLDPAEYCLAKHTLNVATLAAETANMDKPNAKMLADLNETAIDKHDKIKQFVCHKGELPELVEWARGFRKKIEPLYYSCSRRANMHQEVTCETHQHAEMEVCPACIAALADKPRKAPRPACTPEQVKERKACVAACRKAAGCRLPRKAPIHHDPGAPETEQRTHFDHTPPVTATLNGG